LATPNAAANPVPAPSGAATAPFDDPVRTLGRDLFDRLRAQSFDGVGITRETYGAGETTAMALVEAEALRHGLEAGYDAARNLVVTLPGREPGLPMAATGSHLDSVPQGGNFDGAAGVIAGLMALVQAARSSRRPLRTMTLYALRGEESAWFGRCYLGSGALFGLLGEEDFACRHRSTGQTLAEAMAAAGVDLAPLRARRPLMPAERFLCWIELHIEQGPVMVARGWPVGIVTGIRGNIRHPSAICRGEAAHSGAVPRWLRHDAVLALAELLTRLDEHWRVLLEQGVDLVVTTGIVTTNTADHAISRVPGEVRFGLEYRSQDRDTLAAFRDLVRREADEVGRKRGVTFDLGPSSETLPARMDRRVADLLARASARLGLPPETLPSGAGHDAAVFANAGVPAGMLFIRNDKGSHNPHEAMAMEDFLLGAGVLHAALREAADSPGGLSETESGTGAAGVSGAGR